MPVKMTNRFGLPVPVVQALTYSDYDNTSDFSVTGLLKPPQIAELSRRHNTTEDVSDYMWRMSGSVIHGVLERVDLKPGVDYDGVRYDEVIREIRYEIPVPVKGESLVEPRTVSGKVDLLLKKNGKWTLWDFKSCSVYKGKGGPDEEWTRQLNIYRYLLKEHGIDVSEIRVVAMMRDWRKSESRRNKDYPEVPIKIHQIDVWSHEKTWAFIKDRVQHHVSARPHADHDLPKCSSDDMWERKSQYSVNKIGQKKALRLFSTKVEADAFAKEQTFKTEVNFRGGKRVRCEEYCPVSSVCHQRALQLVQDGRQKELSETQTTRLKEIGASQTVKDLSGLEI